MAMTNYPYPTDFLNPLPGNPCSEACKKVNEIINPTSKKESDFL